jgi:uncharacterized protein (DUF697 family)
MPKSVEQDPPGVILRAIDLALTFDRERMLAAHRRFGARYSMEPRESQIRRLVRQSAWKAAASGMVTGFPASPWLSLPIALADTAAIVRVEAHLVARIALLFDEGYLAGDELPYELMVPILGGELASDFLRELGKKSTLGVTRRVLRTVLTKETVRQLRRLGVRYFGLKVTERALVTKSLPLLGSVVGGSWNYVELQLVGRRAHDYFADRAMQPNERQQPENS